jgi:predicted deacylase
VSLTPFALAGREVPPGSRRTIELPIARLPHGAQASLPCVVVHGLRPGPAIWVTGAVHGDELTGVEVIRRVLATVKAPSLRGTLVALPMVNIFGVTGGSRYLPDRRDLNRSFPGSDRGSLAGRLADLVMTEVVARCSVGIDIHSGSDHRHNLPQVRGDLDDPRTRGLATVFGAPIAIHARERSGSLRGEAAARGATVLLYEGGGPQTYDAHAIEVGHAGVLRVMGDLGMVEGAPIDHRESPRFSRRTLWSRASRGGMFRVETKLGATVKKGQTLGVVADAIGRTAAHINAREAGVVVGLRMNPVVFQGDALAHVAVVGEPDDGRELALDEGD